MDIILTILLVVSILGAVVFTFISSAPDKFIRVAVGLLIVAVSILAIVTLGGVAVHH